MDTEIYAIHWHFLNQLMNLDMRVYNNPVLSIVQITPDNHRIWLVGFNWQCSFDSLIVVSTNGRPCIYTVYINVRKTLQ